MSVLQEFLSRRLFDVAGDDERLKHLDRTAAELAKFLATRRGELIPYTLAALDPGVPASEPHVARAMDVLAKQWKTVRDHFGSEPVLVLRAIIAEALRRVGKADAAAAAVIWYSAASYAPHIESGAEAEVWADLIMELRW